MKAYAATVTALLSECVTIFLMWNLTDKDVLEIIAVATVIALMMFLSFGTICEEIKKNERRKHKGVRRSAGRRYSA